MTAPHFLRWMAGWLFASVLSPAFAQTCTKHSPAHTVALLELYTSEGCSSCPPADHFVSTFRKSPPNGRFKDDQVVPLSLHVDYWDNIGWKDLFSQTLFTERQRWLSHRAASRTVYTPEVFVGGHELRNWQGGTSGAIERINARPARAVIDMSLGRVTAGILPISINAKANEAGSLFIALFENALSTDVKAGENGGITLHHDYVVRKWIGPITVKGGTANWMQTITLPANSRVDQLGVAAFIQSDQGEIFQALSLSICA